MSRKDRQSLAVLPQERIQRSGQTASLVAALCLGLWAGAVHARPQSAALTVNEDGAKRSLDIHWPDGYTPEQADLFAHNEIRVNASCAKVWRHIAEAPKWPTWYPNAKDVRIVNNQTGLLKQDSEFKWSTFGLEIDSKIFEFVPGSRMGWFGKGTNIDAYHTWLLIALPKGCQVVTEEVAKGPVAVSLRETDPNAMHRGHDLWLATLKELSEK
jgi:hypothetical protein